MNITWLEKEDLTAAAVHAMGSADVVLDIGCGIMPQGYVLPQVHICCEPYHEYVKHLQEKVAAFNLKDRNYLILNMGWDDVVKYFPAKSVDTVFLIDVVEHLEKEDGKKLLAATENIARKQIVIFTPWGLMPQHHEDGKDAWGLSGAHWQEHKSGWLPEDFMGNQWQFFASKEFHLSDSSSKPLEKPYGAFWAIKTYPGYDNKGHYKREEVLKKLEAELNQKQLRIDEQQREIQSLIMARVERRIRRIFSRCK